MKKEASHFTLEQAMGFQINRAAFLMTEEIAKRFASHGYKLSAQDFGILYRLSQQQSMTQVELATLMMRDKTTITRRIDALIQKKLIQRTPCPDDRRCCRIELTNEGNAALQTIIPLVQGFQKELLADIPEEDRITTMKTLQHISHTIIELKSGETS